MFASVGIVIILIILVVLAIKNMDTSTSSVQETRASVKDFFLHLGAIIGLYTVAVSFINLLFKIINGAFPEVGANSYAWGAGSEISMPVATLIVFVPIFIVLSRMVHKIYEIEPLKKDIWIRRWLTYLTLFVAGIALAVDLVTVLYKFLDGQDLTAAFLLKALTVILVAGAIFWFYIQDIRDRVSAKSRKILSIILVIVILAFIAIGFNVLGSPKAQRLIRYDNQKITDLQNIQWQVISYWQVNGKLPHSLNDITASQPFTKIPTDPQTKTTYEYNKTDTMTFELCAEFNKEDLETQNKYGSDIGLPSMYGKEIIQNNNWNHGEGRVCFPRIIDPVVYPTQVRG